MGYCRWIPSIFSNLSECYRIKKSDELSSYYLKIAENLKIAAVNKTGHKHDILNIEMYRLPPSDLTEYIEKFII